METEIRDMFSKLKSDIEYLRKLERVRTEFLGNVSHELKTPIFAIQGFLETLLNGALEDNRVNRNFLQKANQHTLNLSTLVNDLIDISMIESGEMRMSYRYFNILEYMTAIIAEFLPIAEKKGLYLKLDHGGKDFQLFGDKARIRQVMSNLIENSIKYTENGGIIVKIDELQKVGRISVIDTGIGIPEEDLTRIFERFYRVDKARSRQVGGTGLGLAIVKHIVEAHGSRVEIKSSLGQGTEISFTLKK